MRPLWIIALCATCVGCQSWTRVDAADVTALRAEGPVRLRIRSYDARFVVDDAQVVAGSIVGRPRGRVPQYEGITRVGRSVRVDIGRISEMEVAEPDGGKTAGLVVAILVGGAATVGLAFLALVFIMSGARF